ncbi:MAG: PfkB family carbohydrate kinase [Bacilli bacterium]|nr:PfkB family carbohydrate kinase [Bacilli bacterium]
MIATKDIKINMRVVSIGDLVLDYYYKNGKLIGVDGGMSSHNIIANLAKKKISTAVYGISGNDIQGKIANLSLKKLNVDVSKVLIKDNIKTRCFHVSYDEEGFISKKRCPKCNEKKWYEESQIDIEYITKNIQNDDILVFDNLNDKNIEIIKNVSNKKIIDIGQYFEFENLSKEDIINKLNNDFEIINFNERVSNYLLDKLNLKNNIELYNLLKAKLVTITRGENGAIFIYNSKEYKFNLKDNGNVIDSSGAGDAFISSIIFDYIKNSYEFNEELFPKWYEKSIKLTSKVVSNFGARGHLNSLYKIKKIDKVCTCENFEYNERRKIKRCNININNLESRVINAINSNAYDKLLDINFDNSKSYLFIGTGGSFAGASFASTVINELYGASTYSLYPRDALYRNNINIDKAFLFSYSGTTNDLIQSVKDFNKNDVYVITKGQTQNIVTKTGILKNNIITYRTSTNKGKERGFLSFEGALAPAALFMKLYLQKINSDIDINNFIKDSMSYWSNKVQKEIDKNFIESAINHNKIINVFRGDYSNCASYDLESKLIESGIFNCIIHEKKNFSHGRFINFENMNNKCVIYFKQKTTSKYEEKLLDYLGNKIAIFESRYDGLLAEFDLLIASQFIIYQIGKLLDIDVSKPNYTDNAMKIYFYKGQL